MKQTNQHKKRGTWFPKLRIAAAFIPAFAMLFLHQLNAQTSILAVTPFCSAIK